MIWVNNKFINLSITQVLNDVNVYTADLNTKKSVCLYKRDNRKTNQARCKYSFQAGSTRKQRD
jgi:hypothetical protein